MAVIRVVHVLCDLSGGGAERLVLDLCRRMSGVEASVVTVHSGGELVSAYEEAGVPVVCAERRRGRVGLRALSRIARVLRGADVVHTHLWAGDTWGRLAALLHPSTPVVTTEHNVRTEPGWWRDGVNRILAPRTTHFVAVSEAVASGLAARGIARQRISVIANGVDLTRFDAREPLPEPKEGLHRVLAVGRFVPQKGFDLLVEAAAGLPVALTLVGDGPERERLCRLAAARGVVLELPGWQPSPWRYPAHLAVVPSRWEGFGLTAIEALATGLPVLVSDAEPLPRLVGDAGAVVPRGSAEAIRAALTELLADPRHRGALAARAPAQARLFGIDETARCHATLYERLLASQGTRA